jgi:hypothetical protein
MFWETPDHFILFFSACDFSCLKQPEIAGASLLSGAV